jgi:hypothetical protein
MHTKINDFIILFLGIALSIPGTLQSQELNGKIKMSIRSDKNSFVEGESIWPELVIENIAGKDITIPNPAYPNKLKLILKDSQDKILFDFLFETRKQNIVAETIVIRGGGVMYKTIDLRGYGSRQNFNWPPPGCRLSVGSYTLQGLLENIATKEIQFQVTEASIEQQELAKKINKLLSGHENESIETAKSLIKQYSGNVYLPELYNYLFINLQMSPNYFTRSDDLISAAMEFLDKFPNSGMSFLVVKDFITGYRNKFKIGRFEEFSVSQAQEIENALISLMAKYSDKRVAREIDNKINEQRKKDPKR